MSDALQLDITGIVQGVGFRPLVYRLAERHGLTGFVRNTESGVRIRLEGSPECFRSFEADLHRELPEHASINTWKRTPLVPQGYSDFRIISSARLADGLPLIQADLAPCPECRRELFDPENRRYRYPFINCTHCGPRYSIIEDMPYDRPRTTMKSFPLCPACEREYRDVADRRFHAQPVACPVCGPSLSLLRPDGQIAFPEATVDQLPGLVRDCLDEGKIVTLMGVGGFQLLADATKEEAVETLRRRKGRDGRPFAVMVSDLEQARSLAYLCEEAEQLLTQASAPIVLLPRKAGVPLAPSVCSFSRYVGIMLPSSPLHVLLTDGYKKPLVVTSGNPSGESLCYRVDDALNQLHGIADLFLVHNRPIARSLDDSVVTLCHTGSRMLRRARGYAPLPVWYGPQEAPCILALGSELKNTICWLKQGVAVMSQHLGDAEHLTVRQAIEKTVTLLGETLKAEPELIVADAHPDGTIAELGRMLSVTHNIPLLRVQHHRAHILACLAENKVNSRALGIAWDGTGYGDDGTIWGGEAFLCEPETLPQRIARLRPFALPGGEAAVREPARCACSLMMQMGDACPNLRRRLLEGTKPGETEIWESMIRQGLNSPVCSSMGRMFDAISFLCGFDGAITCEGQAAMVLETLATQAESPVEPYPWDIVERDGLWEWDWSPLLLALEQDRARGKTPSEMAESFHAALVRLIIDFAQVLALGRIAISGGCFQNNHLTELLELETAHRGMTLFYPKNLPCNDGGISFGQIIAGLQFSRQK